MSQNVDKLLSNNNKIESIFEELETAILILVAAKDTREFRYLIPKDNINKIYEKSINKIVKYVLEVKI